MNAIRKLVDDDNLMVPERFRAGHPHADWQMLRKECPVYYCEPTGYRPFWAITKYQDIVEVEKHSDIFLNEPRFVIMPAAFEDYMNAKYGSINGLLKMMVQMDAPDHMRYRSLLASWFQPKALAERLKEIRAICEQFFFDLRSKGPEGEIDLAQDLAFWFPLRAICALLGLPQRDDEIILRLAESAFTFKVPEPGSDATTGFEMVLSYFKAIAEERRKQPQNDLSTYLVQARLDGKPLEDRELLAYFFIAATAGHDTTSSAITGGVKALLENPDQLRLLQADSSRMTGAVEEILRWVTPTIQFARTAREDYVLRGQLIRRGETAVLYFSSGNRDDEAFPHPNEFRIERSPNRHLAFGSGPHTCVGLHLARLELRCFLEVLFEQFEHLEIAGPTPSIASSIVTRLERLPVRYRFRDRGRYGCR
ncbi:MAG: cytochrome P450 [Steroidobacteraceae bacterium]